MNFKFIRKGVAIATLVSVILAPAKQALAAEEATMPKNVEQQQNSEVEIDKRNNIDKIIKLVNVEEIRFIKKVIDKAFLRVEEEYTLVFETVQEDSAWTGKIFANSEIKIIEKGDVWSKIESGAVVGYAKTASILAGKDAVMHAKIRLTEEYPEKDILTLSQEEIDAAFSVGVSKAEEEARIAAEEAARIEAEKEAKRQKGLEVANYAKQFLGNPYVYGGTSLTRGTDCSGFVMSVYAHFGVSLPHSSYSMRSVGYKVSLSEIQPGDIVCFPGHVGIYAGDDTVVNAVNEKRGIKLSNLYARSIVTVRRIF